MSDSPTASAPTPEAKGPPSPEKREQATQVIGEILRLMGYPAKLDVKDGADGGISVALEFSGEVPGVQAGKRSHLIDSLQFIVNKIVNRPTGERRWISIGVGQHPEPRPPPGERPQKKPAPQAPVAPPAAMAAPVPAAPAPAPVAVSAPAAPAPVAAAPMPAPQPQQRRPQQQGKPQGQPPQAASRPREPDEFSMDVPEDAALSEAVRALAKKSAEQGRFYALTPMKAEDRARVVKSLEGAAGMKVMLEGEGRNRRVVFVPDKPAPLPKRAPIPDYGEDEDDLQG